MTTSAPATSPDRAVSATLRRVAQQRLAAVGLDAREILTLLEDEPGSPDDWLAFLALASRAQVRDALEPDDD
jgi:hypothetical protein